LYSFHGLSPKPVGVAVWLHTPSFHDIHTLHTYFMCGLHRCLWRCSYAISTGDVRNGLGLLMVRLGRSFYEISHDNPCHVVAHILFCTFEVNLETPRNPLSLTLAGGTCGFARALYGDRIFYVPILVSLSSYVDRMMSLQVDAIILRPPTGLRTRLV